MAVSTITHLNRTRSVGSAIVLGLVVGAIDYLTGRELQVLPLYLLPLGLVVWNAGWRWGVVTSVLAAAVWLAAELAGGPVDLHAHPAVPYWNALMSLVIFLVVTLILSELRATLQSLERRVEMRTTELRQEMEKRYKAEQAKARNERLALIGTMAAQLAHEVRNPLGSVTLNLELLSEEIKSMNGAGTQAAEESALLLAQSRQEIERVGGVINEYLNYARLPKLNLTDFPLCEYLEKKLNLIAAEMDASRVRLSRDYDGVNPVVTADQEQLWQVLLNLVRNAKESMQGGGEIKIRIRQTPHEHEIAISDTGDGIAETDAANLFTPFFTTKSKGTGLGLALSQRIIAEHGGRIDVHSTVGKGSTFTIFLPRT